MLRVGQPNEDGKNRWFYLGIILAMSLFLYSACAPAKTDQEVQKEVQALKTEVAALAKKIEQLEAGQKQLQDTLKGQQKAGALAEIAPPPALAPTPMAPAAPSPPAITVSQLLQDKDRLVGTRVTVKGEPGPVLIHKKILYLQGPEGMVEVFFGNLTDKKQVERLAAQSIDQPLTVTGMLTKSPGAAKDPTRLQIVAETVDF